MGGLKIDSINDSELCNIVYSAKDYVNDMTLNWELISKLGNITKCQMIKELTNLGIKERYLIGKIPNTAITLPMANVELCLTRSDLSYFLTKHHDDIKKEHYLQLPNVLKNYNEIFVNPIEANNSYVFWKKIDEFSALEITNKTNPYNHSENIIHFMYYKDNSKNRSCHRRYKKLTKQPK